MTPGADARQREADLVARAVGGDARAERALFDAHGPRIYRLCYRLAADPVLAEEFTQDTFVRAFERLHEFEGRAALSTWLHAIAVSVTLNGLRRVRRAARREVGLEQYTDLAAPESGEDPLLARRLYAAVASLPGDLAAVLVMFDVEGYSHEEIAAILGTTPGASRMRLSRARGLVRVELAGFLEE